MLRCSFLLSYPLGSEGLWTIVSGGPGPEAQTPTDSGPRRRTELPGDTGGAAVSAPASREAARPTIANSSGDAAAERAELAKGSSLLPSDVISFSAKTTGQSVLRPRRASFSAPRAANARALRPPPLPGSSRVAFMFVCVGERMKSSTERGTQCLSPRWPTVAVWISVLISCFSALPFPGH